MLDAIGTTITHFKNLYKTINEDDLPQKTLFVITTDGYENASNEYTYSKIHKLITSTKQNDNFEYIFLAANIDSHAEARKMGISKDQAVSYACDSEGIELNFHALGCAIKEVRHRKSLDKEWHKEIDKDVEHRIKNK